VLDGAAALDAAATAGTGAIAILAGAASLSTAATGAMIGKILGEDWTAAANDGETWSTVSPGSEVWATVSVGSENWNVAA